MKKLLLLLMFSLFLLIPKISLAQEADTSISDYASSYKQYVNSYDVYQKALSDYRLARAQYIQAGTLVSQTKAREETLAMLQARDTVVITYLTAIQMKVDESEGIPETFKNGLVQRISAESFWFGDHLARLDSAGTLEDLVADSDEASKRFEDTQKVIYESLSAITNAKTTVLRNELNNIVSSTREKSFEIRSNGDLDISTIDRWFTEIDNKLTRSLDKSIESETKSQDFYNSKKSNDLSTLYNGILASLEESVQLLRDGSKYTREIIKVFTGES